MNMTYGQMNLTAFQFSNPPGGDMAKRLWEAISLLRARIGSDE